MHAKPYDKSMLIFKCQYVWLIQNSSPAMFALVVNDTIEIHAIVVCMYKEANMNNLQTLHSNSPVFWMGTHRDIHVNRILVHEWHTAPVLD